MKIKAKTNNLVNRFYCLIKRLRLKNKDVSIISSNCIGGVVLHELKLEFKSPFVNLWITPSDFITLLNDFTHYMSQEIEFIETDKGYPIGRIGNVTLYFLHYHSVEEALQTWNRRKRRINKDNMFIICSERDGCTYEDLVNFDNLPFENKVVFTHKEYTDIKSSFHIKGFESEEELGNVFAWDKSSLGKKVYDQFDFVKFFNSGMRSSLCVK